MSDIKRYECGIQREPTRGPMSVLFSSCEKLSDIGPFVLFADHEASLSAANSRIKDLEHEYTACRADASERIAELKTADEAAKHDIERMLSSITQLEVQAQRDDDHIKGVEAMNEKHRKNWCEAASLAKELQAENMRLQEAWKLNVWALKNELATMHAKVIDSCLAACNGEQLVDGTAHPSDIAYNNAIRDCMNAIRAIQSSPDLPLTMSKFASVADYEAARAAANNSTEK